MNEVKLILKKLKIVSEVEEQGAYVCDKEHSKILLDYIMDLQERISNCYDMLEDAKKVLGGNRND